MARPRQERKVCCMPACRRFQPETPVSSEEIQLTVEEYETLRLMDLEGYTQAECAQTMGHCPDHRSEHLCLRPAEGQPHAGGGQTPGNRAGEPTGSVRNGRPNAPAEDARGAGPGMRPLCYRKGRIQLCVLQPPMKTAKCFSILGTRPSSNCLTRRMARFFPPRW